MPVTRSVSSRRGGNDDAAGREAVAGDSKSCGAPAELASGVTLASDVVTSRSTEEIEKSDTVTTSSNVSQAGSTRPRVLPPGKEESLKVALLRAQLEEAKLKTALARALYEESIVPGVSGAVEARVEEWIDASAHTWQPNEAAQEPHTDGAPRIDEVAAPPVVREKATQALHFSESAAQAPRIDESVREKATQALHFSESAAQAPRIDEVAAPPAVREKATQALRVSELAAQAPHIDKVAEPALQCDNKGTAQAPSAEKESYVIQPAATSLQATDLAALASAFAEAARGAPRYSMELPSFDGAGEDWLQFKAAYRDSERYYSKTENRARIRRSLRGQAKEAVACLFYGETDPREIIENLEIQFGRPDALVNAELEKIKALPRVKESARDTCAFASKVGNIVATIKALNRDSYLHDTVAVNSILGKFNYTLQHSWFQFAKQLGERRPDLTTVCEFLKKEAEMCATLVPQEPVREQHSPRRIQRTHSQTSAPGRKDKCVICEGTHSLAGCERFTNADVGARWAMAKRHNLCFRCLQRRSSNHRCKYRTCGIDGCNGSHHRRLHEGRRKKENEDTCEPEEDAVVMSAQSRTPRAYLKVIPICLTGPAGSVRTHALLDEGSTVTLVDEKIAARIGARGPVEPINIEAVGGARIDAEHSRRIEATIKGLHHHQNHRITARTIADLNLSPQSVNRATVSSCRHLEDIEEDVILERAKPTVLIGQDNWHLIVSRALRSGSRGQPVASLTHLGWVLHGVDQRQRQRVHFVHRAVEADSKNEDIEQVIRNYFDLDSVGITPRRPTSETEQRALRILEDTCKRLPDGRYEAGLLWKEDHRVVPESRGLALKRLYNTEKRLDKDLALREAYNKQVQHLFNSGYAEPANEPSEGTIWYLPHFAVINPAKPKPRIVYDAAARVQGVSLNDMLMTGPDLLQSLPGVLMRFRQLPVAVTADIKEMFLQIRIREEDRDALRFLWRGEDRRLPPQEYRMTSVVFGAASSPSIAIYVKNANASEHAHLYPEAAAAVVRNHYMDDYLQSFDNEEEAATIASQVSHIHQQAHFQLRGWASNKSAVLESIPQAAPSDGSDVQLTKEGEKVLGLRWRPTSDTLGFNVRAVQEEVEAPTKRQALRVAMSIFDPLGLITPVTIHAKHLLQDTWRIGMGWDEPLPPNIEQKWRGWLSEVRKLKHLELPRAYGNMARARDIELHVFTDASQSAYAAAAFWRITDPDGRILLSLAAAKGRVSPLKFTSIPRLEIQAALLGARLAQHVEEEHDYKPSRRVFWTDSRTVLSWIRNGSRIYKPFVAHRIAEIEDITKVAEWRWVPSKENVADDATRDIPEEFDRRHRWFNGPDFLYRPESEWPIEVTTNEGNTGEERVAAVSERATNRYSEALPKIDRFSSWLRLIRSTGRVLQFIELCRQRRSCAASLRQRTGRKQTNDAPWKPGPTKSTGKPKPNPPVGTTDRRYLPLEGAHIKRAELLCVIAAQQDSFNKEIGDITGGRTLSKDSRLRQLSLIIGEDGVMKIRTRLAAAENITQEQRAPAVLDGHHRYTRLYIQHVHQRLHHSGVEATVNEVLQQFWVVRLRPTVRTVLKSCATCRKRRAAPPQPPTGDLPGARVAHHQRSFTFVGLDYLGPLTVTIGRRHEKRYVALFTCLTSRAVHLEVAASLTTDSAVMALRRMMARRGCPTEIWSDNGTNLRGADAELKRAALEATKEAAANYSVQWRFIPPGAPFMGGAWERMVRSVKTALYAVLKERYPVEEILHTLLIEIEHTLNSRPLTHVSVSPEDPVPLTPNHLLLGGPSRVPIPGAFTEGDTMGRKHWRHAQHLANMFWARWVREALPLLQRRREPAGRGEAVRVGDIVLIVDGTQPRNAWPTGVVITEYPGPDGVVRVVDVRTAAGVIRRPVKKLVCLLTE